MFGSPKANKKRKGAQLNTSDGNLACDEENYEGARFTRRARSFKNDFLDKLNVLRAVNNASFRLTRTTNHKSKSDRCRVHSETELKADQDENESICDIHTISNQYFQVAAKTKTEMLPGNGTVILEILISLKLFLSSKIGFDNSASVTSAKNFMYQSACHLIKICDQVLIGHLNETFFLNYECVLETVHQLSTAVQTLIEVSNKKAVKSTTDLETLESIKVDTDTIKASSIDVPLTNREKEYLDVSFLLNYSNNYTNQSIFKNFQNLSPQPPPKPSLNYQDTGTCPPLPLKKRNYKKVELLPNNFDKKSLSSSSQNDSFVSDSLDSMDSALADFEPEYRQFENVNSSETLNRLSNSESGIADIIGMPNNNNLSWSFETPQSTFACAIYSYTSSSSTISFHKKQMHYQNTINCSNLPPNLPPKQSSIKRQPSPYDNLLNSVEQSDQFPNSYQNFEHSSNLQKPPPLPVKKKHIMVYMEMIGNCSHTSMTNIESRFDKIFVEKSQSNHIVVEELKPPALPPKKNKLKPPAVNQKIFEPLTWNNNDIREVNKEQTHVKCPDLYDLEFLEIENIFAKYLLKRNKHEEGPEIKAGYLESLVFLATKNLNDNSSYQDAFLTTYRTFLSPLDLIKMLIKQYQSLSCQLEREFRLRDLLALLSKLIKNLIVTDLDNELLTTVTEFIHLLICSGDLIQAKILRISLIEKYNRKELFRFQMNLPSPLTLSTENYSLLDFKSEQLAEQMTLLDANLFEKIEIPEVLIWAQEQNEERSPNLTKFTEHFNKMSYWVRSRILERSDAKEREKYVSKFIKIMKYLRKINNFNSYLAILSALDSAPVRRLEWQKQITEGLKEYCALIDSSSSFRAYRQALSETQPPCIPYIGLVLQDLTFIHTGNCDYLSNGMVNFSKRWQQYNVVENLHKFKKGLYAFKKNDRILSFLNNFDNFICEEAMWHISESIKPRACKNPR